MSSWHQILAPTNSLSLPRSNAKLFPIFEMEINLIKKYEWILNIDLRDLRRHPREKRKIKGFEKNKIVTPK